MSTSETTDEYARKANSLLNERLKIIETKLEHLLQTEKNLQPLIKNLQFFEHKINSLCRQQQQQH